MDSIFSTYTRKLVSPTSPPFPAGRHGLPRGYSMLGPSEFRVSPDGAAVVFKDGVSTVTLEFETSSFGARVRTTARPGIALATVSLLLSIIAYEPLWMLAASAFPRFDSNSVAEVVLFLTAFSCITFLLSLFIRHEGELMLSKFESSIQSIPSMDPGYGKEDASIALEPQSKARDDVLNEKGIFVRVANQEGKLEVIIGKEPDGKAAIFMAGLLVPFAAVLAYFSNYAMEAGFYGLMGNYPLFGAFIIYLLLLGAYLGRLTEFVVEYYLKTRVTVDNNYIEVRLGLFGFSTRKKYSRDKLAPFRWIDSMHSVHLHAPAKRGGREVNIKLPKSISRRALDNLTLLLNARN